MANNPSTLPGYNGQTAAPDANYTYGSARDDASPGDLTGTPRIASEINDILGLQQAVLNDAGIVPSGNPDTVLISQYLSAFFRSTGLVRDDYVSLRLFDSTITVDGTQCFITLSGIGGAFAIDKTDTTSADDGGVVIVDSVGGRWKRQITGELFVTWWGTVADGVADDTNVIKAAHVFAKGTEVVYPKGHYRITDNIDDGTTPIRIKGVSGSWQHNHIVDTFSPSFTIDTDDLDDLVDQASVIFCDNCSLVGSIDTPGNFNAFFFLKSLRDVAVYGDNGSEIGVHVKPLATEISGCLFSHFEWFGVCTRGGITFTHANCGYDTNGFGLAETGTAENSPDYGSGCNLKIGSSKTPEDYHGIVSNDRPTTFGVSDLFMWATNSYVQDGISGFRGMQVHGLIGSTFDRVGSYQGQYFATCEDVTLESPYVENYAHDGLVASDELPIGIYQTNSRLVVIQDSLRNLGFGPPVVFTDIVNFVGTFGVLMNRIKATTYTTLTKLGVGVDNPTRIVEIEDDGTPSIELRSSDGTGAVLRLKNGTREYSIGVEDDTSNKFKIRNVTNGIDFLIGQANANITPGADNTQEFGGASLRWKEIFAGVGAINTSDGRLKQQERSLNEKEKKVAVRLKSLIKMFRFNDSVDSKGDKARLHCGLITQEVEQAFTSEKLDAHDYALFCYNEWEDEWSRTYDEEGKAIHDENGKPVLELNIAKGDRYGLRYDQILAFIIAAI